MPVFLYEAKNLEGKPIKNKMEAQTKEEVIISLRQRGYFPLSVVAEGTGLQKEITIDFLDKVTLKDLSLFCRQFSFVILSGMPMLKAIELSMEQCEKKKLKDVLRRTYQQVQKGRSLSEAFKHEDSIPDMMVNMIEAGESSGKLDYIMSELSDYYSRQYKQQQKVSQATMYPRIVIVFSLLVLLGMMTFVVPQFVGQLASTGAKLPLLTQIMIGISNTIKNFWFIWIAVGAGYIGYKKLVLDKDEGHTMKKGKRKIDGKLFGAVNKQLLAGRFASTFSILLSSGMSLITAMEISAKVLENKYLETKLNQAKEDIKKGNPIGKTIEDLNVFPRMLTQMITVGEETGQLEEIMVKTSKFYEEEANAAIEKMISLIEPMLIIGLAAIVFFIVLSIFLPMFSMYDAIGGF